MILVCSGGLSDVTAVVSEFGGSVLKDKERCFDSLIPCRNPVAMCFNRFGGP